MNQKKGETPPGKVISNLKTHGLRDLLDTLAAACAELGRWEFQLVVAPLVIPGGTGSPVNPIAIL